jgi:hypothetical protein
MTIKASAADTDCGYTLLHCTWPADVGVPLHVHYEEDEGFYVPARHGAALTQAARTATRRRLARGVAARAPRPSPLSPA